MKKAGWEMVDMLPPKCEKGFWIFLHIIKEDHFYVA